MFVQAGSAKSLYLADGATASDMYRTARFQVKMARGIEALNVVDALISSGSIVVRRARNFVGGLSEAAGTALANGGELRVSLPES